MPIDLEADRSLRRRVGVERYATILAHCIHSGPDRAGEVAARFGLDLETWLALDAAWSRELAESSRRQQNLQATRFTTTLFRVRAELALRPVAAVAPGPGGLRSGAVVAAEQVGVTPQRVAASFQLAMPTAAVPPAAHSPPAILVTPAVPAVPTAGPIPAPPIPVAPTAGPIPAAPIPAEAAAPAAPPAPAPSFALPERRQGGGVSGKTEDMRESRIRAGREQGALPFDDGELPISLETYARVTARLAQRADRSEVLAGALLDEERWQAVARRWSDRLRRDAALMRKYIELVGQMKGEG